MDAEMADLLKVKGIGLHSAVLLKLVKDLGVLYLKQQAMEQKKITQNIK